MKNGRHWRKERRKRTDERREVGNASTPNFRKENGRLHKYTSGTRSNFFFFSLEWPSHSAKVSPSVGSACEKILPAQASPVSHSLATLLAWQWIV